jgi:hypothetical protein
VYWDGFEPQLELEAVESSVIVGRLDGAHAETCETKSTLYEVMEKRAI